MDHHGGRPRAERAGVLLGRRVARALPAHHLKYALVTTLFALAPYLALHG
ncbi:hypothetical protein ACWEWP_24840 [Streptomyces olivaceus]